MVPYSKRKRQCRAIAAERTKKQKHEKSSMMESQIGEETPESQEKPEECQGFDIEDQYNPCAALEGSEENNSEVEEESSDEEEEGDEMDANAFASLKQLGAKDSGQIKYARGPTPSDRHQRRLKEREQKELDEAEANTKVTSFFAPKVPEKPIAPPVSNKALKLKEREDAIRDLEALMASKRRPQGAQFKRHHAVLSLLYSTRSRKPGELREDLAVGVARNVNMGDHFAKNIVSWEKSWIEQRVIPEDKRGRNTKIWSLLNDESVKHTVRAAIDKEKERITAFKLAKIIANYLASDKVTEKLEKTLEDAGSATGNVKAGISQRTARTWLNQMGLRYGKLGKGVFVDGHERVDVVDYRQNEFCPRWISLRSEFPPYDPETKALRIPLAPAIRPVILVTHDESTFSANDGTKYGWTSPGKQPLRPKGRGKGIMVSAFLTPVGLLRLPPELTDDTLLGLHPDWPRLEDGSLIRESVQYLEYDKDHYWDGDKMVKQTIAVIRLFKFIYPQCRALSAFDNAASHCAFSPDALVASKMNLRPGGKQPRMKDGWFGGIQQSMMFPDDYEDPNLRDQPKGIQQVLEERGLWTSTRVDGERMPLKCNNNRGGCAKEGDLHHRCCATSLLADQPDFRAQKGRLQEEVESMGYEVIFYPKFHCEVNFIERFWSSCKHFAWENCTYTFKGLRLTVRQAVASVEADTIYRYFDRCDRTVQAYATGATYETKAFTDHVYTSHRQIRNNEGGW